MIPHSHHPKHDVKHVVLRKEERWCWYLQAGQWTVCECRRHSCLRSASPSHLSQQQHCCWSKMLTVFSAMVVAKVETADEDSTGYHHWPLLAMEHSSDVTADDSTRYHHWPLLAMEHSSDVACYAYYSPLPLELMRCCCLRRSRIGTWPTHALRTT